MLTSFKRLTVGLFLAVILLGAQEARAEVITQTLWRLLGGSIFPISSSTDLGSYAQPISDGYFGTLHASSTDFSSLSLPSYLHTQSIGTLTVNSFNATSTTATSTIQKLWASAFQAGSFIEAPYIHATSSTLASIFDSSVGIGTTSPLARLTVHAEDGHVHPYLFMVASSTASATTSLFTIDNRGQIIATPLNSFTGLLTPAVEGGFTYATTTAWTGTTTIPIGAASKPQTFKTARCFTDTGTLNISVHDGTNKMDMLQASTTVGTFNFSTNNSFVNSEKRYLDIGTPGSSPTNISCTFEKVYDAQ